MCVCVYIQRQRDRELMGGMEREIYFKESVHAIMELASPKSLGRVGG